MASFFARGGTKYCNPFSSSFATNVHILCENIIHHQGPQTHILCDTTYIDLYGCFKTCGLWTSFGQQACNTPLEILCNVTTLRRLLKILDWALRGRRHTYQNVANVPTVWIFFFWVGERKGQKMGGPWVELLERSSGRERARNSVSS